MVNHEHTHENEGEDHVPEDEDHLPEDEDHLPEDDDHVPGRHELTPLTVHMVDFGFHFWFLVLTLVCSIIWTHKIRMALGMMTMIMPIASIQPGCLYVVLCYPIVVVYDSFLPVPRHEY